MFQVFSFIHHLDDPFFFILIVLISALLVGLMKREYSLGLFIAVALTFISTHTLKNIFRVARPEGMVLEADGFRFPSLHASLTAAIVVSLALYGWRWLEGRPYKNSVRAFLGVGAFSTIATVNASRVALNVHEPIDVFVGALIGAVIAWGVHVLILRLT